MKKVIALLAGMIFYGVLYAQSPVNFGIKIGMNYSYLPSSFDNINILSNSAISGYQGGFFLRISIKSFIIQPEVYFSMKGGQFNYTTLSIDTLSPNAKTSKILFYNIDIPLLFGYSIVDKKLFKFRVMAGPVASYVLSSNLNANINGLGMSTNSIKSTIWGIQTGLGIDLWKFTFDFRYEWGLNNISSINGQSMKTQTFLASLGFKF